MSTLHRTTNEVATMFLKQGKDGWEGHGVSKIAPDTCTQLVGPNTAERG